MSPDEFDLQLASALGDDEVNGNQILPGKSGAVFSASARQKSTVRACREYTRWRPLQRKYGTGYVYTEASQNSTQFLMVGGGGYTPGQTITIDPYQLNSEECTIKAVQRYSALQVPPGNNVDPTNVIQITTTTPLLFNHNDAAYTTLLNPGLQIYSLQDTYDLPYDWIKPNHASFDIAIGVKLAYKETNSYYDASYYIAAQMTGLGFGYSQTYGVGSPFGYAIAGDPFNNPNGAPGLGGSAPPGFRFYGGDYPKLVLNPIPEANQLLQFDYYAQHTVSTIPTYDEDAVLSYALYACITRQLRSASWVTPDSNFDRKIAQVEYMPSHQLRELRAQAKDALRDFDIKIRLIPYMTSG